MSSITDRFGAFARVVNAFASSPQATVLAFALVIGWAVSGPHFHYSDFWQLIMNTVSAIITFLMVFVLNNAQSRDTAAVNAKLDAIIRAMDATDNRLIGLESQPESEAKAVLEELRAETDVVEARLEDATDAVEEADKAVRRVDSAMSKLEDSGAIRR